MNRARWFCISSSNLQELTLFQTIPDQFSEVGFQIQKSYLSQLSKMIFARGAISMVLTYPPRFPLLFDKEEALTGTAVTVGDEGARADKGGVEGSIVSSDKYIIITIYLPSLIYFFQSLISVISLTQMSRRKPRPNLLVLKL